MTRIWFFSLPVFACLAVAAWADTVVLHNGTSYTGRFVGGTTRTISFREENGTTHRFAIADVESVNFNESGAGARAASNESSYGIRMIPEGTDISVRTNEPIDSSTAAAGQTYSAQISQSVLDRSGNVAIPRGSPAQLVIRHVSNARTSGSDLALDLQSVTVNGRRYDVATSDVVQQGREGLGANKRTGEMVGGGAALGALVGAIAGGGKGAGIGAAVGGGGGAVTEVLTRGKRVRVPAEAALRFKLERPVQLRAAG